MADDSMNNRARRRLIMGAAASVAGALATPALAQMQDGTTLYEPASTVRNNISSFRMLDWRDHFENTRKGAILADTVSRAVHFWSEDGSIYKLYPSSVPLNDELTRKGRTEVIEKVTNPPWRPTASMKERNPDWPDMIPGGAPENPLGPLALYLGWPAYRIHGTHDTRKIGRKSSNGCIGLYNEHITELFGLAQVGTQVLLI